MTCTATGGTAAGFGVQNWRTYSILGAKTVTDKSGVARNLIKIRNPIALDQQGSFAYPWSDIDTANWTPAVAAQVGFVSNVNDGVFFIEDKDFVKAFSGFVMSYNFAGWVVSAKFVENQGSTSTSTFAFTLTADAPSLYVGMQFYNYMMYPKDCHWRASSSATVTIY